MTALLRNRARVTVAITTGAALLLLLCAGYYVVTKHTWADDKLAEVEPRYARLLGLRDNGAQLEQAVKDARVAVSRLGHLPDRDAAQVGNDLQQIVRRGLAAADVAVSSSQVLPVRSDNGIDQVGVAVQAEGALSRIQLVLAALQAETPSIAIDGLVLQPVGRNAEDGTPIVACRLTVSVLRLQS